MKTDLIFPIIISVVMSLRVDGNPLKLASFYNDSFCYHVSMNEFPNGLKLLHSTVYGRIKWNTKYIGVIIRNPSK